MTNQTPVQIAWVTRDLGATESMLSALLGAKKWVRMADVHFGPDTCRHRGEPADYRADISLSYAGDTQLEVIAPTGGTSIYTEFLDEHGPGLHHICLETDDFDATLAQAASSSTVVAQGEMPGGMKFAYVSAPAAGVPFVEYAAIPAEIKAFFDHVRQEQK